MNVELTIKKNHRASRVGHGKGNGSLEKERKGNREMWEGTWTKGRSTYRVRGFNGPARIPYRFPYMHLGLLPIARNPSRVWFRCARRRNSKEWRRSVAEEKYCIEADGAVVRSDPAKGSQRENRATPSRKNGNRSTGNIRGKRIRRQRVSRAPMTR